MEPMKTYQDYFDIDPKYYPAVTADLIKTGRVKWNAFYPHETFIKLLNKTIDAISGTDPRSLWVEGAYGTGKSHAALTIKCLLEARDEEVRAYFQDYGLSNDLCERLIAAKNAHPLITIHRIGSASIRSDQDLILAIQDSVMAALKAHGIQDRGEASLRQAAIAWLEEKEANRAYFNSLIQEERYMWDFGGRQVDEVLAALKNTEDEGIASNMMRNILRVAEDNGITAMRMDIGQMCSWLQSVVLRNGLTILFVWDEFTEFFINNPNSLTGFQTLTEISESTPFYFMIVTHESSSLIKDNQTRRKILDRFSAGSTIRIELPENMAFQLLAQAMKETNDPVLQPEWHSFKQDLNDRLTGVRNAILTSVKKTATMGSKTLLQDEELQAIVPIHPYAALLLKHMSVVFNSNARSMFDFVISTDVTDAKAFRWFISKHGPLDDENNLLTIDMLWDFFTRANHSGLNDDVRVILDAFNSLKAGSLTPDQERVFKTVLLLEAISTRVSNVELLRPNEQNIDLAFNGTDWNQGKAKSIAAGLCQQGLLFEKAVGSGMKEYTVANIGGGNKEQIARLKQETRNSLRTQDLIATASLLDTVQLPAPIRGRYLLEGAANGNFAATAAKARATEKANHFTAVVTFALNDEEARNVRNNILKTTAQSSGNLLFIECLTPMGEDLLEQYVSNVALSKNYLQSDRSRSNSFESAALKNLSDWKQRIASGAFMLYTPEYKSGTRVANLTALQEELARLNRQTYYYSLEQYSLTETMFTASALGQGAECGLKQEEKGPFHSSNKNTSLSAALNGAWQVVDYWKDPTKKGLPIVHMKNTVDEVIQSGFQHASGRISMLSIFEALEDAPFGFIPCNVSAFVLGFLLKEYATSDYFWSNGSTSESMSVDKMKLMIANALKQKQTPNAKYKEEYIVAMSMSQRCFLQCTSTAFGIPMSQCGSIEGARDQIRIKMKGLAFPIWCLKYLLDTVSLASSKDEIAAVIDAYCGIANTANSNKATESDLAEQIGNLVEKNPAITEDLKKLLTNDMCYKGMRAYIDCYRDGELHKLANEIGDNGAYLDQVKQKFNADAANWVWNSETADEKISDVILEYRIIAESNHSLTKCTSLYEVVASWNKRTNNIRMPYDHLRKYVGDLKPLLEQLYYMKQNNQLLEQNKQKFYDALLTQRKSFDTFYANQLAVFEQVAAVFLDGISGQDVSEFFNTITPGQFTKSANEYDNYLGKAIDDFKKSIKKTRLRDLWFEKTGTKDPADWSNRYDTPILCMFDDAKRSEARQAFSAMTAYAASDTEIAKAIAFLEKADFFDKLNDPAERDRCFMERVVGEYSVMLSNADMVRRELRDSLTDSPYTWMDNSTVKNRLKNMAEKQYRLSGCNRAMAVIEKMDASELRRYLNELITDNLTVGMEILKNE